jgi:argininosuccinate lyase
MAHDSFYWLGQINKASLVINADEGLLDRELACRVSRGLVQVLEDGDKRRGRRPGRVITFEPLLIEAAGIEATRLHVGRSSQDMHTAATIAIIREETLVLADQLRATTLRMLQMAEEHAETLVPNYTNGVAAQPNTYGHYLLGHIAGLLRDAERLQQFYARLDRSPMGTTVLNGSSWPLNRDRMAAYLGFGRIADNAFDAVQISITEMPVELGGLCVSMMLHVGTFIQDIMVQYAQPRPWILLREGDGNTYVSSAMPQKRNPGILNSTRADASRIVTLGVGRVIQAHNITPGMIDVRSTRDNVDVLGGATMVLQELAHILDAMDVRRERALEELNSDWTASQEVADVLMRRHDVPFRLGHHFVSEIVGYARENNIRPDDFPFSQAQEIWKEVQGEMGADSSEELPMSEEEFRATLDPAAIVQNRATAGGPQPAEMQRMLKNTGDELNEMDQWIQGRAGFIESAMAKLEEDFSGLL